MDRHVRHAQPGHEHDPRQCVLVIDPMACGVTADLDLHGPLVVAQRVRADPYVRIAVSGQRGSQSRT